MTVGGVFFDQSSNVTETSFVPLVAVAHLRVLSTIKRIIGGGCVEILAGDTSCRTDVRILAAGTAPDAAGVDLEGAKL
ncbi:MAG: hypothetical protein HKP61_22910 [Dactylosporangium sp.]|nr:hypothetical protein [Dactylosporangium sp.]NNJ63729.1 hypothetical protein [Dactylosporangium sp.]